MPLLEQNGTCLISDYLNLIDCIPLTQLHISEQCFCWETISLLGFVCLASCRINLPPRKGVHIGSFICMLLTGSHCMPKWWMECFCPAHSLVLFNWVYFLCRCVILGDVRRGGTNRWVCNASCGRHLGIFLSIISVLQWPSPATAGISLSFQAFPANALTPMTPSQRRAIIGNAASGHTYSDQGDTRLLILHYRKQAFVDGRYIPSAKSYPTEGSRWKLQIFWWKMGSFRRLG
jgi:hypothetical protein